MSAQLIHIWRQILIDEEKPWALFQNGTCVILVQPLADIRQRAVALLSQWGRVHAGSSAGDFSTITLKGIPGWVVTCHHDDILTNVAPDELSAGSTDELTIGLFGRSKRHRDASELEVIHVEGERDASQSLA